VRLDLKQVIIISLCWKCSQYLLLQASILTGLEYNFDKMTTRSIDSRGSNYDTGSVMHYGGYAFSANNRPTITDLNGKPIEQQASSRLY